MYKTVSESATASTFGKPTREERDAAYSTGAGRKAQEITLEQQKHESATRDHQPPVGLDLETRSGHALVNTAHNFRRKHD